MNRIIFLLILGLIASPVYVFYSDLVTGNLSSLFSIKQNTQEQKPDLSILGHSLSEVDWTNPIVITHNFNNQQPNLDENSSINIDSLINESQTEVVEIDAKTDLENDLNTNVETAEEIIETTIKQPVEQLVDAKQEPLNAVNSSFETQELEFSKKEDAIETLNNNEQLAENLPVTNQDNAGTQSDNLQTSDQFIQEDNNLALEEKNLKNLGEKANISTPSTEQSQLAPTDLSEKNNDSLETVKALLQTYAQINREIEKISQTHSQGSNQNMLEVPHNSTNQEKVADDKNENELKIQFNPENINSEVIQTIISTRKLLESLQINLNKQSLDSAQEKTIANKSTQVEKIQPASESTIQTNSETSDLNRSVEKNSSDTNENLDKNTKKQIREFSKGMIDYAIGLDNSGEAKKALTILLQIEPHLSDDMKFLRTMIGMQKKLGNTEKVIEYLIKAVERSVIDGDYANFQEMIGEVMQIDALVAGDLIQKYAPRFQFNTQ